MTGEKKMEYMDLTKMTVEELKEQRKRIDNQIKTLKNGCTMEHGRTKIDIDHFPSARPDEYGVYIKRNPTDTDRDERWISVIRGTHKEVVINQIPALVEDLQGLFNMLVEDIKRGQNDR